MPLIDALSCISGFVVLECCVEKSIIFSNRIYFFGKIITKIYTENLGRFENFSVENKLQLLQPNAPLNLGNKFENIIQRLSYALR